MEKKQYIIPVMEIARMEAFSVMKTSIGQDDYLPPDLAPKRKTDVF